ncbi:MAG TPA: acyl-CoA thioesterase [Allosphingosinicella sp.]|nr:acyl-CoA thioesterase [Allosphingosinicella sp.]
MADETDMPRPPGEAHLRTIAMPRDANPAGDIFGGWTLSQMDLAGATFAAERAGGRVATVSIEAMKFLHPISVGDEVSCFCSSEDEGKSSVKVKIETWTRSRGGKNPEKVTEGLFTFVAVGEDGKPRRLDDQEED